MDPAALPSRAADMSGRAPSRRWVNHYHHHDNDQQQVNQTACHVQAKTQEP
jgi:hypothetical protein